MSLPNDYFFIIKLLEAYGKYVEKGDNKDMKQESSCFPPDIVSTFVQSEDFPVHVLILKMNRYKLFNDLVKRIPIFILQNKVERLNIFCLKEIN